MKELMILLSEDQVNKVKGIYNKYYALIPMKVIEGYALPIDVLYDPVFSSVHELLSSYPRQEVTFLPEPEDIY